MTNPRSKELGIQGPAADLGGIPNIGNTCYMNSVLQIFAKLYPNVFRAKSGNLAQAGQKIVDKIEQDQEAVTKEEAEAFYKAFLAATEERALHFVAGRQEDAEEAFSFLFDECFRSPLPLAQIETIVQGITPASAYHTQFNSNRPDLFSMLSLYTNARGSVLMQQLFAERLRAGEEEHTFAEVPINLAQSDQITQLYNLYGGYTIEEYTQPQTSAPSEYQIKGRARATRRLHDPEKLQIKGRARVTKKLHNLEKLQNDILPIRIARYHYTCSKASKNTTAVQQPLQLTIKSGQIVGGTADIKYELVGFVVHIGPTANHGHYVAYINREGQWTKYDDGNVAPVTRGEAEKEAEKAYLYFYKKAS